MTDYPKFADLLGKTLIEVAVSPEMDEITFTTSDGERFIQYHSQDCCETVAVNDIAGDFADLIGSPLLLAEEIEHEGETTPEGAAARDELYPDDSFTWTFYKLATNRGRVTIRWFGSSNGYYSESVDFRRAA